MNFPTNGFPGQQPGFNPQAAPNGFPGQQAAPGGFPAQPGFPGQPNGGQQPNGFPGGSFPQQPPGGFPGQQSVQPSAPNPGNFPGQAAPGFPPQQQQQQQQQMMQPPQMQQQQMMQQPPQQQMQYQQPPMAAPAGFGAPPAFPSAGPPGGGAGAGGFGAGMHGAPTLDGIFAGADGVAPQSRTPRLDVNGVYLLELRKITGGFTDTEKMPFVEFEWSIVTPDPAAGPTMPIGKIVGMFIPMSAHKYKDLFIANVKEILIPVMSAKYRQEILPHQVDQARIVESYGTNQPYVGVRLWVRAQNSGKISKKGNAVWDYNWHVPQ